VSKVGRKNNRKQIWIDKEAHNRLQEFKERNGGSVKGVASEAIRKYVKKDGTIEET